MPPCRGSGDRQKGAQGVNQAEPANSPAEGIAGMHYFGAHTQLWATANGYVVVNLRGGWDI